MMITDLVKDVLQDEGSATFLTTGPQGPHLVATWQSYIQVLDETTIAFPAGGYRRTEGNIQAGSPVQMILGGHPNGKGTGFRLTGRAEFQSGTPVHDQLRQRFPWCRAAVVMRVTAVEKVLG